MWKGLIFKRDISLVGNQGIKFEKLLFVSPAFYKLVEGAESDTEMELIINNAQWKIAIPNERGKKYLGMK